MFKNYCVLNCMFDYLQEVRCVLGFLVTQVDPEDPAKKKVKRYLLSIIS